jgi:hypothetical protein
LIEHIQAWGSQQGETGTALKNWSCVTIFLWEDGYKLSAHQLITTVKQSTLQVILARVPET